MSLSLSFTLFIQKVRCQLLYKVPLIGCECAWRFIYDKELGSFDNESTNLDPTTYVCFLYPMTLASCNLLSSPVSVIPGWMPSCRSVSVLDFDASSSALDSECRR